jgi:predicted amidophosphoribosyltransferase
MPGAVVVCRNCGNDVPKGVEFCDKCGAPIAEIEKSSQDDRVYEYIVNHKGVISLRAASTELGITVDQLREITERLKRKGRLS